MGKRVSTLLSALALAVPFAMSAGVVEAQDAAQCRPGDVLCAEVQVGPVGGRLRIGPADPPPVIVEQAPPVVVAPAPPPVIVAPPPPPVVVVQPPPPPQRVVYVQPAQQQVYVQPRQRVIYDLVPNFDLGVRVNGGIAFGFDGSAGGGNVAFRLRPSEHFALDLGIGVYGGFDGSRDRWEMPLQLDALFFFNPEHRFQIYALIGVGTAVGQQGDYRSTRDFRASRDLAYLAGEVGLGAELRLSRFFALNADVRGFLREQVLAGPPEFSRTTSNGTVESTNTSGGFYVTAGMTLYFIGL